MPTALRPPPAIEPPTDPRNRLGGDVGVRLLTDLHFADLSPFDVEPTTGATHAALLAAHCPDLFLVAAPPTVRTSLTAELTALAVGRGERVLVLGAAADELFAAVRACGVEVGRAVGPNEGEVCAAAAEGTAHARGQRRHAARRAELSARATHLAAGIAAGEQAERLLAELATTGRAIEQVTEEVEQSAAMRQLITERDAGVAAVATFQERRAALEQELSAAGQATAAPGFFKRLFGGTAKAEPAKAEEVESKLRELDAQAPPDPHPAFATAREQLVANRRQELDARIAEIRAELAALPSPETLTDLRTESAAVADELARLDSAPAALPNDDLNTLRVVVGPPSAVGHDPFLSGSHPEVEPRFDRVVWADGEELSEPEFAAVSRFGSAWVLLGTPDPLHPPGYRNGRPRGAYFARLWEKLHSAVWTREDDRPLARLVAVEQRTQLVCEPLHDRPEVEVRFADRDGEPVLAEVVFPADMPTSEAKTFLAREAGEVRCGGYGPCEWETASVRCRWPVVDAAAGTREAIDLGDGVCEHVVDGVTSAVTFAGEWTRDSAARWLADRLLPCPRTAVL